MQTSAGAASPSRRKSYELIAFSRASFRYSPTIRISVLRDTPDVTRPPKLSTHAFTLALPSSRPAPPPASGKVPVRTRVLPVNLPGAAPLWPGRGITNASRAGTTAVDCWGTPAGSSADLLFSANRKSDEIFCRSAGSRSQKPFREEASLTVPSGAGAHCRWCPAKTRKGVRSAVNHMINSGHGGKSDYDPLRVSQAGTQIGLSSSFSTGPQRSSLSAMGFAQRRQTLRALFAYST